MLTTVQCGCDLCDLTMCNFEAAHPYNTRNDYK